MGDPFSIGGTAVGVTSLGFQVCEGLVKYYSQYRSYRDDIDAVVRKAEGLSGILNALENVKSKIELENDDASEQLQLALNNCGDRLRKLKQDVTKCNATNVPGSIKDRAVLVKNRLLWPFKKSTVLDVQNTLCGLQDNLSLALQIMNLDVESRRIEAITAASNSLVLRTDRAHQQMNTNSQSLKSIEDDVKELSVQQRSQASILASHTSSNEKLDAKLDIMINGLNKLIVSQQSISASLTTASHTKSTSALISRLSADYSGLGKHELKSDFVCRCLKIRTSSGIKGYPSFFSVFWTSPPVHFPGCSFYNSHQRAHIAGTTFKIPGRKAMSFIEAILTCGALPLQCTINYRNIVPFSAPAFKILFELGWYFIEIEESDLLNVGNAFKITLRALSLLFQIGRAGPADTNKGGWGIVHYGFMAIENLFRAQESCWHYHVDEINSFMTMLTSYCVTANERDSSGGLPLDFFLRNHTPKSNDSDLIIFRIPALRNIDWSWSMCKIYLVYSYEKFRYWSLQRGSRDRDPFHLSILQKSESLLLDFRERRIISQDHSLLLHQLVGWPDALGIVLVNGHPINILDSDGYSALDYAITIENVASIELLLHSDIQPTAFTWLRTISCINYRSEIIFKVAPWLVACIQRDLATFLRHDPSQDWSWELYHWAKMDVEAANALYSAGLLDIDACGAEAYESSGTPLWNEACRLSYCRLERSLDLLHWFIDNGARMEWVHPHCGTTTIHILAERVAYILTGQMFNFRQALLNGSVALKKLEKVFHMSLNNTVSDKCVCLCATNGCASFTTALKTTRQCFRTRDRNFNDTDLKRSLIRKMGLSGILGNDSTHKAIIRVLTFDHLGLTHTCHNHNHNPLRCCPSKKSLSKGEILDIHYSEEKDIKLLEQLLLDFDIALADHHGTLLEFIDSYWMEKMDQVVAEKFTPRYNELDTVFRQVGVVLRPEKEPPQEELPVYGKFERFVWEVEKIMGGK